MEGLEAAPPATSRHTKPPLWLLPSGPDQVHGLSLREDQQSHPNVALRPVSSRQARSISIAKNKCKQDQGIATRIANAINTTPVNCSTRFRCLRNQASNRGCENSSATSVYQIPSTNVAVNTRIS